MYRDILSTYQYVLVCTIFSITYQYVLGTDRYIPVCTKNHDFVQPVTIPEGAIPDGAFSVNPFQKPIENDALSAK